ncbi:VOC family protein [Bryobacter aggregatus]|uniref:VOC family protein n=1 Tax=Bryobacter aggregatus TaxID=360054 RepID=UPI0004E23C62|nr:VOC family protein [Bryobacter aggregatus]
MKIVLCSVMVEEQQKALEFYTEILGFVKKEDIPMGAFRWLTVVSADAPDGVQLLLEPNVGPGAKTFQETLFAAGVPLTSFAVEDVQAEYQRMTALGVKFHGEPRTMGPVTLAIFEDGCGNLIQLAQQS